MAWTVSWGRPSSCVQTVREYCVRLLRGSSASAPGGEEAAQPKRKQRSGDHRYLQYKMRARGSDRAPHLPMQNVEKMRLRMSSAVVAPVMASMGRSAE